MGAITRLRDFGAYMLNIGGGEILLIAVVALLVLGPKRLPEMARSIGKLMREFRRHTDSVRGVVEHEFYKMDQALETAPTPTSEPLKLQAPEGAVARGTTDPAQPEASTPVGPAPGASDENGGGSPAPMALAEGTAAEPPLQLYYDEKDYPHEGDEADPAAPPEATAPAQMPSGEMAGSDPSLKKA